MYLVISIVKSYYNVNANFKNLNLITMKDLAEQLIVTKLTEISIKKSLQTKTKVNLVLL